MSHVKAQTTEYNDLDTIKATVEETPGLTWLEGQETYKWYESGWQDDSPVPEGIFTAEEKARVEALPRAERVAIMNATIGRCVHAVRVDGSKYEIGVVQSPDGKYRLLWDYWGSSGRAIDYAMGGRDGEGFRQRYQEKRVMKQLSRQRGRVVSRQVMPNGEVKLLVSH